MGMVVLDRWVARWAMVAAAVLAAPGAWAEPQPIEHFTRLPNIGDVYVSPSGKRMAMRVMGSRGLHKLAVMELDPIRPARVVAGFGNAGVTRVQWVNDDRLVYEAFQPGAEVQEGGGGVYAVNHDGTRQRTLIIWRHSVQTGGTNIAFKVLPYGWFLHSAVGDGGNDVFVYRLVKDGAGDVKEIVLARLDSMTGKLDSLSHGMPRGTVSWLLDAERRPRMLVAFREGRRHIYWRAGSADDSWTPVAEFRLFEGFEPWLAEHDGGPLVLTQVGGGGQGIHRFDPIAKRLDPNPLVAIKGFDLEPTAEVATRSQRLLGMHFRADRPMSLWLDEGLERVQRGIDAAMPAGRSNRLYCGECETSRFIVVHSSSDRQPGEYFLFDREKRALEPIGAARPWIDESRQGRRTLHKVTVRDGLVMPVYVTHPAGVAADKPLPTVVLVHGGPWVRGTDLNWKPWAQFLASRGYRVLEPEFRGSTGYGQAHLEAGFKQWGRAMQDDLADAVKWATGQKLTDASKVCIMGASYGGYAALMGPIAHPGTYQCAISYAGVTDIDLMYGISWSDTTEFMRRYDMPVRIGDREKDAELLAAASPLKRASEIKVPVLLAHGMLDKRVPPEHTSRFLSQARKAGVAVEHVSYGDEAHNFDQPDNETDFLGRVERFLEKSLGAAR